MSHVPWDSRLFSAIRYRPVSYTHLDVYKRQPLVYAGIGRTERHARAKEVLEQVGLGDKLRNRPNQLSGGQQDVYKRQGHGALSLGNVIGANVFNLVLVSGVSAVVAPFTIPQNSMLFGHNASLVLEFPVMFAVMLLLTLPALIKGKLSRPQGIALLCIYAAFCAVQFSI